MNAPQPPAEHYIVPARQLSGTRGEVLAQIDELILGLTGLRQLVSMHGPHPAETPPRKLRLVRRLLKVLLLLGIALWAPPGRGQTSAAAPTRPTPRQSEASAVQEQSDDLWRGVVFGGTLETFYQYNWNRPPDRVLPLRAYVTQANTFAIQQAALIVDAAPDVKVGRRFGGRVDVQFGMATDTLQGNPANEPRPEASGANLDGREIRKGAADAVTAYLASQGGGVPPELKALVDQIARSGGTPLVVAERHRPLGVIHLKDIVKGGMQQRFDALRAMGIRTVMITGDNPLTAAAIAREAGVDDFLAEAKPEDKMSLIRREQAVGKLVAMTGDGTNDAPALAQADVGVAMNTGTTAAKEAGNMVDLDSNPTKLIEIVEIGKQLLMTRGALTTFSIANDVAKYFAIIPAMFILAFPQLGMLNVMRLATPESAILAAVIFNALIIIGLIPLALKGIAYRPLGAASLLRRNLLVYGLGGVVLPFVGIKVIDMLLAVTGLA